LGVLTNSKFKAFLALSSTANLGFLLMLKGYSVSALGLYLLFYVLSLAALLQLFYNSGEGSVIQAEFPMSSTRGTKGNISKVLARTIILLSLTGLPPLLGFYAKSVVFFPLTALGIEFTGLILTVLGLTAAIGYIRLAVTTTAPLFQSTRIEEGAGNSEQLNLVAFTVVYTAAAKSLSPYVQVFIFRMVALSLILPPLLVGIGYLLGTPLAAVNKTSSYECGFISVKGQGHKPVLMSFFTVGILFLLFDLEIL
jgi:NADH:ubiquinone oxidoreductase subunit 2 (subunit N)